MSGKYLLDTNIIIALFANESSVQKHFTKAKEVFVPCVALGELYYGAQNSQHQKTNVKRIDDFTADSFILFADAATAKHYGFIKSYLKKKGRPIPENDIWIAALATQYHLTLVTRDGHFDEINELDVEAW